MEGFKELLAMIGRGTARAIDAEVHRPRGWYEQLFMTRDEIAGQRMMEASKAFGRGLRSAVRAYAEEKAKTPAAEVVVDAAADTLTSVGVGGKRVGFGVAWRKRGAA